MGLTKTNVKKYLGYKMYKFDENENLKMIRITKVAEYNDMIDYIDLDTGEKTESVNVSTISGFTPLDPVGCVLIMDVGVNDSTGVMNKDVIIACYRMIDLKLNINEPFAICRQSINDFFASTLYPDKDIVGVSVTRDNCPAEIDYRLMVAANTVFKQDMIHIYYEDTIDDILKCATHLKVYNRTLNNLQESYINSMGLLNRNNKASINGWCKDLPSLLKDNNYQNDLDTMMSIEAVDFNISEHLVTRKVGDKEVEGFDPLISEFFRVTFQIPAVDTIVVKYDHDIDLAEFNNTNYIKMRDNTNTLYIVVYRLEGQFLEKELEEWKNRKDISEQIRIAFYNKYAGVDIRSK